MSEILYFVPAVVGFYLFVCFLSYVALVYWSSLDVVCNPDSRSLIWFEKVYLMSVFLSFFVILYFGFSGLLSWISYDNGYSESWVLARESLSFVFSFFFAWPLFELLQKSSYSRYARLCAAEFRRYKSQIDGYKTNLTKLHELRRELSDAAQSEGRRVRPDGPDGRLVDGRRSMYLDLVARVDRYISQHSEGRPVR